jgi:hypothetical protein
MGTPDIVQNTFLEMWRDSVPAEFIGKYLSSLRKLDHIIAPKEGFEAQL